MVRKTALMGLASVATLGLGVALAGGPAGCAPKAQVSGFYVGADVGAGYNSMMKNAKNYYTANLPGGSAARYSFKHSPWSWTASALVGYQFDNHWSVQFGYIWNQKQTLSSTGINTADYVESISYRNYQLYLALRGMISLNDQLKAFLMVGPAYTNTKASAKVYQTPLAHKTEVFYSPMGAVGLSYDVNHSVSFNFTYLFIMNKVGAYTALNWQDLSGKYLNKNTQRLTLGVNYLFAA